MAARSTQEAKQNQGVVSSRLKSSLLTAVLACVPLAACSNSGVPSHFAGLGWIRTQAGLSLCGRVYIQDAATDPWMQVQCFMDVQTTSTRELVDEARTINGPPLQRGSGYFYDRHGSGIDLRFAQRGTAGWNIENVHAGDGTFGDVVADSAADRAGVMAAEIQGGRGDDPWSHFFERTATGWIQEDISGLNLRSGIFNGIARLVTTDRTTVFVTPVGEGRELVFAIRSALGSWRVIRHPTYALIGYVTAVAAGSDALVIVSFGYERRGGWQLLRVSDGGVVSLVADIDGAKVDAYVATDGDKVAVVTYDLIDESTEFLLLDRTGSLLAREALPEPGSPYPPVFDSDVGAFRVATRAEGGPPTAIVIQTRGAEGWSVARLEAEPPRMNQP